MNKQDKQAQTPRHKEQYGVYQREKEMERYKKITGIKCMMTENLTLGG